MNLFLEFSIHYTSVVIYYTSVVISIAKQTRYNNVSNLFYFGMTLYMFRTVFQSNTSSSRLYTAVCLLASRQQYMFDICLLLYVQS